jgi:bifunctional DNase/RNase
MTPKKTKGLLGVIGLWLITATCSYAETPAGKSALHTFDEDALIRVNIYQLVVDPTSQQPVVSLSDSENKRILLIWIGLPEARAIYSELEGIEHERPLTHDLLARVINKVSGKIKRIVITHTEDNIFYAMIEIKQDETIVEIDARPSDSIVMALKFKAPIFVSRTVFEKMSIPLEPQEGIEEEYGLTIQELTPELAKYLSFESKNGVMVSAVQKGSRAEKDGIETGDIIVEVDERAIENALAMKDALTEGKPTLTAKIFRESRFLTVTLHLR